MSRWAPAVAFVLAIAAAIAFGALLPRVPLGAYALVCLALVALPGAITARATRGRSGGELLVAAPVLATLVSLTTWTLAHPVVHVDNATGEAIQLWVDGEPTIVLPPGRGDREPPRVRLSLGAHRIGYSPVGADRPMATTSASVWPLSDFLYSPGEEGCYWLEAAAYGDASTLGLPHGPQRVDAFYRFDRVDTWFDEVPAKLDAPRVLSGRRRVAVQRYGACMELQQAGCTAGERALFVECQRSIQGPGESIDCYDVAMKICALQRVLDAAPREDGASRPAEARSAK